MALFARSSHRALRSFRTTTPILTTTSTTTSSSSSCSPLLRLNLRQPTLRTATARRQASTTTATTQPRPEEPTTPPTYTPAPTDSSGPLMSRRSDRALPSLSSLSSTRKWLTTLPIFLLIITVSALAIFNYQKSSSSVINATLYALRTSPKARAVLGEEIYFRDKIPWIWGELNQLHGRIDVAFWVKGKKGSGFMRFRSFRKTKNGFFETVEWSLETPDGQIVPLLEAEDPFKRTLLQAEPKEEESTV